MFLDEKSRFMPNVEKKIVFFIFSSDGASSVKKRGNTWKDRKKIDAVCRGKKISYLNAYSDIVFARSSRYKMRDPEYFRKK